MSKWMQLFDADSGEILLPRLYQATTFWERFRGLQLRRPLPADQGLLLSPCRSIHTHWMRFSIDLIWLDRERTVLAVHKDVKPWRMMLGPAQSNSVIETTAQAIQLPPLGARLSWRETSCHKA